MSFRTYFSQQARKPYGWFGRWIMSNIFDFGSARLNRLVYDILSLQTGDHILEIGCGTGKLIDKIARIIDDCVVEGVDFSDTMVSIARRNNRNHIENGKVVINEGNVDNMQFKPVAFNKICSVNPIYFWSNPDSTIQVIHRFLKRDGMLLLGYEDIAQLERRRLDAGILRFYTKFEVETLLSNAGFVPGVKTESIGFGSSLFHCSVAIK